MGIKEKLLTPYLNAKHHLRQAITWREMNMKFPAKYCKRFAPPKLTAAEKKEISSYWAQFGVRVTDYNWYRMYYHATGIHDPRFVQDDVVGLAVYPHYNDAPYVTAWRDKNMFDRLLPDAPLPKTVGRRVRSRYCAPDGTYYTEGFAEALFRSAKEQGITEVIVKNARLTGFGIGVRKYPLQSVEDAARILREWEGSRDYIVQECLHQHPVLADFNESSVNMLRVYSWRHGDKVEILRAAARVGLPGAITDFSFENGRELIHLVGVSPDGVFADRMLDQDGQFVRSLTPTPVPGWDKLVETVRKNHLIMDNFDIIGWDFTIDEQGEPKILEWNINWPGTVLYQYTGGPLFGDRTEEIFAFLKNKKLRKWHLSPRRRTKIK